MPQLNIPSDSSQKKVIKAFKKIGFIALSLGKGSHQVMQDPKTGDCITVQYKIYKILSGNIARLLESWVMMLINLSRNCNDNNV
ncbi:MAG: type II toxin-antitoxin system HicA family toxin [bacterium]